MVPWFQGSISGSMHGSMVLWFYWFSGSMGLWFYLFLWFYLCSMVLWFHGSVVLWFYWFCGSIVRTHNLCKTLYYMYMHAYIQYIHSSKCIYVYLYIMHDKKECYFELLNAFFCYVCMYDVTLCCLMYVCKSKNKSVAKLPNVIHVFPVSWPHIIL